MMLKRPKAASHNVLVTLLTDNYPPANTMSTRAHIVLSGMVFLARSCKFVPNKVDGVAALALLFICLFSLKFIKLLYLWFRVLAAFLNTKIAIVADFVSCFTCLALAAPRLHSHSLRKRLHSVKVGM